MTSLLPTPEPPDPVEGALGHFEHTNWVKASLKALDTGAVHAQGGVGQDLTVQDLTVTGATDAIVLLKGNAQRGLRSQNAAGLARWRMLLGDNTAEGGVNSGSRFSLLAFADDGSQRHTVLDADRNTGLVTVVGAPTAANGIATKAYADSVVPIGTIIAFGGSAAKIPAGWHICDGSIHGSSALQDVIGSTTTPDLRARFIIGVSPAYAQGSTGGAEQVTLTQAQTPVKSHTHTINHDHGWAQSGAGSNHGHTIDHDHAAFNTGPNTHSHTLSIREGTGENDGYFLDTNPTDSGTSKTLSGSKTSDYTHSHSVDVPYFSGWSGGESAHTHWVTVPAFSGSSGPGADAAATGHENRPPYYALIYIIKKV